MYSISTRLKLFQHIYHNTAVSKYDMCPTKCNMVDSEGVMRLKFDDIPHLNQDQYIS
jgi:hypothetical protein